MFSYIMYVHEKQRVSWIFFFIYYVKNSGFDGFFFLEREEYVNEIISTPPFHQVGRWFINQIFLLNYLLRYSVTTHELLDEFLISLSTLR